MQLTVGVFTQKTSQERNAEMAACRNPSGSVSPMKPHSTLFRASQNHEVTDKLEF